MTRSILDHLVEKFGRRTRLSQSDRDAILQLGFVRKTIEPHGHIVREGDLAETATLIIDGLVIRHKVTRDGGRQILSLQVPGDFVDLENAMLRVADHGVQALTRCDVAVFPRQSIVDLIDSHPRVGRALWIDTLIDASIYRECILNIGRRDARAGLAHLLCEYARRLELAGLAEPDGYQLPMTQEQLADALGLTPVHVARVLKQLAADGLIRRDVRNIQIPNWEKLKTVAGFKEGYLHLEQVFPLNGAANMNVEGRGMP